ncbi:MAG: peptidase S58 [Dehalococcoidia bacterium]|nr:peptidase S58 [Dehalococcoidia bacterium]
MNNTITSVKGLTAGHFTDLNAGTGCTVVLARNGASASVAIRGGSPGTRETDLLSPERRINKIHGIMLAGSSAFGLATADGALTYLRTQGVGHKIGENLVPIVPAAILYDLNYKSNITLTADHGVIACEAASKDPLTTGAVGAGTGATVAKTNGSINSKKGGIGCACITLNSGIKVAAVVAVNSYGSIYHYQSGSPVAIPINAAPDYNPLDPSTFSLQDDGDETGNTTIGIVATDADINKSEANYIAGIAHDGLALSIKPCHTMRDGDTLFAIGTGETPAAFDIDELGIAAVNVTAQAVLSAVTDL